MSDGDEAQRPTEEPHSREQFGEQRDFWWNADYLALLRSRLAFPEARTLLDVGCGQCHWMAIAVELFEGIERAVGVDFEQAWVEGAPEALTRRPGRAKALDVGFVRGDAQALPLPDAGFDVVTCQTVLMHLASPERALAEMFRVVRPGGLVLLAEPANSPNFVSLDTAAQALDLDALTTRYRFWVAATRGRKGLGIGDWDLGNRLLELLEAVGAERVEVFQNDRVNALAPPYQRPHQRALLGFDAEWEAHLASERGRAELGGLARAGGLDEAGIEAGFEVERRLAAIKREQVAAGTYVYGGGATHYVAWGRRPA